MAVKVQRPGIREQIAKDLDAFSEVAQFLDDHTEAGKRYEFQKMLDEFRKTLLKELDYKQEAQNLIVMNANLAEFDVIVIPLPVEDYTTSRILTMDYIHGQKVTSLSPLKRIDIDGSDLARQLFRCYLRQILVDGFFHADPHPGMCSDRRRANRAGSLGWGRASLPGCKDASTAFGDQRSQAEEVATVSIAMATRGDV